MVCPKTPPMIIPSTSLIPAKTMVANRKKAKLLIEVKFDPLLAAILLLVILPYDIKRKISLKNSRPVY